jgi:hypothetical protein
MGRSIRHPRARSARLRDRRQQPSGLPVRYRHVTAFGDPPTHSANCGAELKEDTMIRITTRLAILAPTAAIIAVAVGAWRQ